MLSLPKIILVKAEYSQVGYLRPWGGWDITFHGEAGELTKYVDRLRYATQKRIREEQMNEQLEPMAELLREMFPGLEIVVK